MATPKPFLHAGFLGQLEHLDAPGAASLSPLLAQILWTAEGTGQPSSAVAPLIQLLQARQTALKAAFATEVVADELRRYQKFAKPGRPSPQIVQLRQQQASARQASGQARQSFIRAAAAFVREAGIEVPQRMALEPFTTRWLDVNLPGDAVAVM